MDFFETLRAAQDLLRQQGKASARALKRQFGLDDDTYDDLKAELVDVLKLAREEEAGVLVWAGPAPPPLLGGGPVQAAPASEGARRFLTVMFADLVDATPLSERLDPEQLGEVYRAWQDACIDVIRHYGGHVAEYRGDGAFIHFGYPIAQEDAAPRAIHTGLAIIDTLQQLNLTLQRSHGVQLAVRIGVHSGLVMLSNLGGRYAREQFVVGETPNLAARLQALAAPGQVLVSDATQQLAKGQFEFTDLGEQTLKGLSRPVRVWRAERVRRVASRLAAERRLQPRLVGRESELAMLRDRWALALERHGRVVLVSGEAGIGKTRLIGEHRAHVELGTAQRVTLHCSPYHGATVLHPVATHLERLLGLESSELSGSGLASPARAEAVMQRLTAYLRDDGLDAEAVAPLVGGLLGLGDPRAQATPADARAQRSQLIGALVQWLFGAARRRPLLLICEDLQWADPTTLEMLGLFIEQAAEEPVLALLSFRDDFRPPWPQRSHMSQIVLSRLSDADAKSFAASTLGDRLLDDDSIARIVERADGVPLYIEELMHALSERMGSGSAIPDTLQGSLMARLDRESEVREITQLGAAAGREFSFRLLREVATCSEEDLQRGLDRLVDRDLLQRRGSGPDTVYRFRHALIRDAAYESTLKTRRAEYHQRIADALETHFAPLAAAQPELLARHCCEAGQRERAVELWRQAGERALNRCANEEALAHLEQALAALAQLPVTPERARLALRLQVARGAAFMMLRGQSAPEVEQAYGQARAWADQVGAATESLGDVFPALMGLWRFYGARGQMRLARDVAERMLDLAQASGNGASLLGARMALGMTLFHLGDMPRARELVLAGHTQYANDRPDDREIEMFSLGQHPAVACGMCLSFIDALADELEASRHWQAVAVGIAQSLASPFQSTSALGWSALLHHLRDEPEAFVDATASASALADQHRFPLWMSLTRICRGLVRARQGDGPGGLAEARGGLAMADQMRLGLLRPRSLVLLAEAEQLNGRTGEALASLDQARAELVHGAECWWEPELLRLQAAAMAHRGDPGDIDEATARARQARAMARERSLRLFERRAGELEQRLAGAVAPA